MAILVERGYLDYEEKVAHYWPEFAQNGKENVTVRMLLNHEVNIETNLKDKNNTLSFCLTYLDQEHTWTRIQRISKTKIMAG